MDGESSSFDYRSLLPLTRGSNQSDIAIEEEQQQQPSQQEVCCSWFPEMTWRERLIGCGTCMVAGYLLSLGSFFRLKDLVTGNPLPYVLNATVGNMIALAGSFFLSGPVTQSRRMWHEKRRKATVLYIGSLVLTLLVAFTPVPGKAFWLLILMVVQYVSILWYTLSYIPFAQEAVWNYSARLLGRDSTEY